MEQRSLEPLLRTVDMAVGHDRTILVRSVYLELRPGELVALIGVNGSGKSTLLKVLAGLRAPLKGSVLLDGVPVSNHSANARARRIAMVLTGRQCMGPMAVRDLVALGRYPWTGHFGRMTERDLEHIARAMGRVGIDELAMRHVDGLSDGEQQRVMIARALAQDTPVLLLDEPTAFLDLVNRVQVMRSLRSIADDLGKAVLMSTHDLRAALDMADRIALIHGGYLWIGTAQEAIGSGVLREAFTAEGLEFDATTGDLR